LLTLVMGKLALSGMVGLQDDRRIPSDNWSGFQDQYPTTKPVQFVQASAARNRRAASAASAAGVTAKPITSPGWRGVPA